jgi:hypothetical protein
MRKPHLRWFTKLAIFTVYKDRGVLAETPGSNAFRDLCEKLPVRPEIFDLEEAYSRFSTVSGVLFQSDQVLERFRRRFLFRDLKM